MQWFFMFKDNPGLKISSDGKYGYISLPYEISYGQGVEKCEDLGMTVAVAKTQEQWTAMTEAYLAGNILWHFLSAEIKSPTLF